MQVLSKTTAQFGWNLNCHCKKLLYCYNINFPPKQNYLKTQAYFYASAPKVPEALCFRVVRPDVRPDFRPGSPSGFFRLRDNSSITWLNFIKFGTGVHH